MNIYNIILTVAAGALVISWMMTFDSIIRKLHKTDHKLWISLGAPRGWFWRPSDRKWFKGSVVRRGSVVHIVLCKPKWIAGKKDLRKIWTRMFLLELISIGIPFLMVIIRFSHPTGTVMSRH